MEVDKLTLICKVNNLHFKVLIEDPVGQLQADCLPPIPESKCTSHFKDRSISQNIKTNETTFILKGNIDSHVNGYWTCRHGTKVDLAKVDVTVLTIKGYFFLLYLVMCDLGNDFFLIAVCVC